MTTSVIWELVPPGRSRAAPLRGVGQSPTSEAKPSLQDALRFATGMGEYQNSPIARFALLQTEKKDPLFH